MLVSILENNFFLAGMPSPLPDDFRALPVFSGSIRQRLESISFFLFAFLCMTVFVQFLWNSLAKDFPKLLPRMRFSQALAFVLLLGTLFVIVLTMISGARELLTPGAWKKTGWTYTLPPEEPPANNRSTVAPSSTTPTIPEVKRGDV